MHKARIIFFFFLSRVLSFDILHVQIFLQQNTLGGMKFCKSDKKWQHFFFFLNASGERVKIYFSLQIIKLNLN